MENNDNNVNAFFKDESLKNENVEPKNDYFESVSDPFGGFEEDIESTIDYPKNEYIETPNNIDDEVARKVDILGGYNNQNLNNDESINKEEAIISQNYAAPTFEDLKKVEQVFKIKSKSEKIGFWCLIITCILLACALTYSFILQNEFILTVSLIVGGILLLLFLLVYLLSLSKRKKIVKRYDLNLVKNEMIATDAMKFNSNIYLTKNYIVSYDSFPIVLKYDEIAMLYNDKRTVNDGDKKINVGMDIITILKNGDKLVLLKTRDEKELELVIKTILERNPTIILGLSSENKERLKKMQDFYKKHQKK